MPPLSPSARALYRTLRRRGPAAWAEVGGRWSVVTALSDPRTERAALALGSAPGGGTRPGPAAIPGCPVPASGWWGYFGYEAAAWFDRAPAPRPAPWVDGVPLDLPRAWLARSEAIAVGDRQAGRWALAGAPGAVDSLRAALAEAGPAPAPSPRGRLLPRDDRHAYEGGVARVLEHLRAGDCYQVNLARRVDVVDVDEPDALFERLARLNPARRGMLLGFDDAAVVSNSPELLLSVRRVGERLEARSHPIKGTRLAGTPGAARSLLRSPKERAELTMIVDLVRADLARVSAPGSIVALPRRVGRMGHVLHAVQPVLATLDGTSWDAFRALFPAGSVTGAPRIAAMAILDALEDGPRGVYCGSLGWFGDDGCARWNVAIRTITCRAHVASFHVGAGLVLGSDPAREYEETRWKGLRMIEALTG